MVVQFDIRRQADSASAPYRQIIAYETDDVSETVATALETINRDGLYLDASGKGSPIRWECSCLQKKCGACAMVIGGWPRLACDTFLREFGGKTVTLEPLGKFPVVADLTVDRSVLFENLKRMTLWSEQGMAVSEKDLDLDFESSRCLQCGCCLEVCPNFYPGGVFAGTASAVPAARLVASLGGEERKRVGKEYRKHVFEGCGKSLACRDVCPAGIDIDRLLSRSNAAAVWGRRNAGRKG